MKFIKKSIDLIKTGLLFNIYSSLNFYTNKNSLSINK